MYFQVFAFQHAVLLGWMGTGERHGIPGHGSIREEEFRSEALLKLRRNVCNSFKNDKLDFTCITITKILD